MCPPKNASLDRAFFGFPEKRLRSRVGGLKSYLSGMSTIYFTVLQSTKKLSMGLRK